MTDQEMRVSAKWTRLNATIITDLPEAEYRAHSAVNISALKALTSGIPADYIEARKPRDPTPAMQFGTLVHTALLEPSKFCNGKSHHVRPEGMTFTTKEGKAWRDAHADLPIIPATGDYSLESIMCILGSVSAMPEAARVLSWKGENECCLFATDPETGVEMKCKVDRLSEDDTERPVIVDVKTTDAPEDFDRTAIRFNYHLQDAYYTRIAELNGLNPLFLFIVIGTSAPFSVRVGVLPEPVREEARRVNARLLALYRDCAANNYWPAYKLADGQRVGLEVFNSRIFTA